MTSIESVENRDFQLFRSKEGAVKQLATLLSDPVLKEAMRIVQSLSEPDGLPDNHPGMAPDTTIAHHYHFHLGIKHAMNKLRKLATVPNEAPADDPEREEFADHAEALQPLDLVKEPKTTP